MLLTAISRQSLGYPCGAILSNGGPFSNEGSFKRAVEHQEVSDKTGGQMETGSAVSHQAAGVMCSSEERTTERKERNPDDVRSAISTRAV